MPEKEEYIALMTEIIGKQSVILGPEIAVLKARNVPNITVGADGKVVDVKGDFKEAVQKLVDIYVDLSGQIVKNALGSVFAKYPNINK